MEEKIIGEDNSCYFRGMNFTTKVEKKKKKDAAGPGVKRLRSTAQSASQSAQTESESPQLELGAIPGFQTATTSPSPKRTKPQEVIEISGNESSPKTLSIGLEELPFPENFDRVASTMTKWIKTGLSEMSAKYEGELARHSKKLASELAKADDTVKAVKAENAKLADQLASSEMEAEKARSKTDRLKAELDAARAELDAARAGQGGVLRAFARRLLLSGQFSALAKDLAGLVNENEAVDALEEAAKDFPDLDVSKYGYERRDGASILTQYATVLRDHLGHLPVVEDLASSPMLLTAEQIAACPTDRDPGLDAIFESLPDRVDEDEEEEEVATEAAKSAGTEEGAEIPLPEQPTRDEEVRDH